MKIKVIITELLLVSLAASLLCGCRKSYTAEISISESREETVDNDEEENIVEKTDESSSADETSETKESGDEDTTSEKESPSGNSAEIESEVKNAIYSLNEYLDNNSEFSYTFYKDEKLLIVKAGSEYAYELTACMFDSETNQIDCITPLGNERTHVYVLPKNGKIVTISSEGVGEEYYVVYDFGTDEDLNCYYIDPSIEVKSERSDDSEDAVFKMIGIGGEYVEGEDWPDAKERLINESDNFLTEDYGYLWANEQDPSYDIEGYNSSYSGTSFAEAIGR